MKKTKHFQKKGMLLVLLALVLTFALSACQSEEKTPAEQPAEQATETPDTEPAEERSIILATTTSTQDSGLLDFLLPEFKNDTNITVNVVAKGTGAALELGKNGDADGLLVHAKAQEEQFVKEGYGVERFDVMYNDFVIVGPEDDTAGLKTNAPNDPIKAFELLSENKGIFISRGDDSGTHTKEKSYWDKAGITPEGDWYISAGSGMGAVLQMADEKQGYTLTDRATYLSMKDELDLVIITEKNDLMYNQYGVIMVNPEKYPIKKAEVQEFIDWILSEKGQNLIAEYGVEEYGEPLFIPNAQK